MLWKRWGLVLLAAWVMGSLATAALAWGDDRASAQALVQALDQDAAHKEVLADPLRRAKDALERATRMRQAGDEAHARIADGLALTWAQMAQDLVRAVDAENAAEAARRAVLDAGARAERERASLEEGIARAGRLRAELEALERGPKGAADRTSPLGERSAPDAGTGSAPDAGRQRPAAPPKPPAGDGGAP